MIMKTWFTVWCLVVSALLFKEAAAQSGPATLDVVSWNIEYFGAPYASGPADKNLQEINVKKLMRYFDADLYGLVEIVDTMRLRRVRDSLGANFEYIIAPYSTDGAIGTNGWRQSQKLAFLYKKDIFSNISTRGMMLNSPTAVSNWANGRLPFLMKADVTINGVTKTIHFIVIHAKSGSTATDYNRRLAGAQELKDTLDAHFSNATIMLIGDFNDALNQTISTGSGPQSSFQPIVMDSTDADHYKSITLPLANLGQTSMINFPNVIDNHVISNEVGPYYILQSAMIRTDVTTIVPDYVSAHNTSDHYPVFSKYNLSGVITSVPDISPEAFGIRVSPNPFRDQVLVKTEKNFAELRITIYSTDGSLIRSRSFRNVASGSGILLTLPPLQRGMYLLRAETKQYSTNLKLVHL